MYFHAYLLSANGRAFCLFVKFSVWFRIRAPPDRSLKDFKIQQEEWVMKKLTVTITDKNGEEKDISVYVENETAEALEQCSEEIRRMYILDEYEDQKLTHKETRRHISYEQITELGLDIASDEESPGDMLIRLEENSHIRLKFTPEVVSQLAEEGFDPVYGARPLRRAIQRSVEDGLSSYLLSDEMEAGTALEAYTEDGSIRFRKLSPEEMPKEEEKTE
jgi:hypothetical protein